MVVFIGLPGPSLLDSTNTSWDIQNATAIDPLDTSGLLTATSYSVIP